MSVYISIYLYSYTMFSTYIHNLLPDRKFNFIFCWVVLKVKLTLTIRHEEAINLQFTLKGEFIWEANSSDFNKKCLSETTLT